MTTAYENMLRRKSGQKRDPDKGKRLHKAHAALIDDPFLPAKQVAERAGYSSERSLRHCLRNQWEITIADLRREVLQEYYQRIDA